MRSCTECTDPTLCQRFGLLRRPSVDTAALTIGPAATPVRDCALENDKPAAMVYRLLLALADAQGIDLGVVVDGNGST